MKSGLASLMLQALAAVAATALLLRLSLGRAAAQPAPNELTSDQASARPTVAPNNPLHDVGERGRSAETPTQIPPRGWRDILMRVWDNIMRHRVLAIAAGVAFYALLAVFPAIAAIVSIYGLFADPSTIRSHLDSLGAVLPSGALSIIGDQISRIAGQGRTTLGLTTFLGLAVSLWSANAGMKALFDALNVVYQEEEKRGFFKLNALSLGFTVGAILIALIAMAAVVALPPALSFLGLPAQVQNWINLSRWPLLLVFVSLAASVIYRYGPSRNEAKWRWLSWGAVAFTLGWLVASLLFSWYTSNFGSYNKTYGSLGAVVGFMTWLWITNIFLLIGAEINGEAEHQTAADTTRGASKPLGRRGAVVADTVAPSKD